MRIGCGIHFLCIHLGVFLHAACRANFAARFFERVDAGAEPGEAVGLIRPSMVQELTGGASLVFSPYTVLYLRYRTHPKSTKRFSTLFDVRL